MAKTQMASQTVKLHLTIRDNVKAQLVTILNCLLQVRAASTLETTLFFAVPADLLVVSSVKGPRMM